MSTKHAGKTPAGAQRRSRDRCLRARLTARQQRFVEEFLVDCNVTQAAIRAGYRPRTAGQTGHENLKKPEIAEAIEQGRQKLSERTEVAAERVVEEWTHSAFFDPADLFRHGPITCPEDLEQLPEHVRRSIASWGWDAHGRFLIKLRNKDEALGQLGKHLGLFDQRGQAARDRNGADATEAEPSRADLSMLTDEELRMYRRLLAKIAEGRGQATDVHLSEDEIAA